MSLPIFASILGGIFQSGAASKAARAQETAARNSLELQRDIFDETSANLAPFREAGVSALNRFTEAVDQPFESSPGFQFRLQESNDAIEASAAARGGLFSGNTLQSLDRNSQNFASGEFDNYLRRLQGLSASGQNAAATQGGFGQAFGNQAAQQFGNIGNAQSAGFVGAANGINTGIQNALGAWQFGQQQAQNQQLNNALRVA